MADSNINTLNYFYFNRVFRAGNGSSGRSRGGTGKRGVDVFIKVPWGTRVIHQKTNKLLGNMGNHQKLLMVAKGGRCGLGQKNRCFRYSYANGNSTRFDRTVIRGEVGEVQHLILEMMLIADVGLLGLPNSGKSTFLNTVSSAHSKAASYPFTTLEPCLGVVQVNNHNKFIIADVPGIIKGASTGLGLGIQFLKHLEHCRILLHFVDVAPVDNSDPVLNIITVEQELSKYSKKLLYKPRWLIFNKIDLLDKSKREVTVKNIVMSLKWTEQYYFISSIHNINTSLLCNNIMQFIIQNNQS